MLSTPVGVDFPGVGVSQPEILTRETVYAGYLTVERLTIGVPGDERPAVREIESHGSSAAVLPYDPERRTALIVRQSRAPVLAVTGAAFVVEVCAGMIDAGETAEAAGRREAVEELGVRLANLERVACVWPSPGVSTERSSLFLAAYGPKDRLGPGGGLAVEHEDITVIEVSLTDLAADADHGRIVDAKLLILALALRVRRPELFI